LDARDVYEQQTKESKIRVFYTKCEGTRFYPGDINLTMRQVVRRLNRAFKNGSWLLDPFKDPDGNLIDLLPPLHDAFHSVVFPDGREWDAHNGWRGLSNPKCFTKEYGLDHYKRIAGDINNREKV